MEMTSSPASPAVESPHAGVAVVRERLSRPAYLDIYRAVGEAVQWDERQRMDAADLDELLAAESSVVLVLRVEGRAAGLCEFSGFGWPDVELVHFGLVPEAQGKGAGPLSAGPCIARLLGLVAEAHLAAHRHQRSSVRGQHLREGRLQVLSTPLGELSRLIPGRWRATGARLHGPYLRSVASANSS